MRSRLIYAFLYFLFILSIWLSNDLILDALGIAAETGLYQIIKRVVSVLFWISTALFANQIINYFLWHKYFQGKLKTTAPRLLKDITFILILIVAITIIIGIVFKQPLTGFWATSGVTALIIGFALRNMILDLFSGLAINIERPYKIGDWIEIHQRMATEKVIGEVVEISWRATHVKTEENTVVVVPNSIMTTMVVITNYWDKNLATRYEDHFTLDFSVSTEKAKRVLLAGAIEATNRKGFVADKTPQVLVEKTDDLGVTYKIRYWITPWKDVSPSTASDEINSKVLKHLWHAGITPAYPKEDIFYEKMPVRQLDDDRLEDRNTLISKVGLFSDLKEEEINRLSENLVKKHYSRDEFIVNLGENGASMFVLVQGLLDVLVPDHKGEMVKVSQITPSDYFGEMSLLTGETRSASIKAATNSVIYEITKENFNKLISCRKGIIDAIGANIAERKAMNDTKLEGLKNMATLGSDNYEQSIVSKIRKFFGIK